MQELNISADSLVGALLNLPADHKLCLLDSCGVSNLGSRYLIAGLDPVEILEINESNANKTLDILSERLSRPELAAILTISYEFGLKLNGIVPHLLDSDEPDVFLALFDCLIVHDYDAGRTFFRGNENRFPTIEKSLFEALKNSPNFSEAREKNYAISNFTRENYLENIGKIQEFIRCGDTYQTNLTQQLRIDLPRSFSTEQTFLKLRRDYPAPFAAFLRRKNDVAISASPERFLKVQSSFPAQSAKCKVQSSAFPMDFEINKRESRKILVSPIKGTRPRGRNLEEDRLLREELLASEKDRAENLMIVDLLRNDIGRVCEYGSVEVEKLCDLETHPTLFHLVSTVRGRLREDVSFSDILKAAFPCGSITGAPKISTMQIIDALETAPRGLSMGTIGYVGFNRTIDLSVAIRTMVIRQNEAFFNVGGGIVIDSIPEEEYAETLTKAQSLLNSLNAELKM